MYVWMRTPEGTERRLDFSPRRSVVQFAVGAPEGPRSSVWLVQSSRYGDLYIGTRSVMPHIKLSLHVSGIRRLAWTKEFAVRHLSPGADRVVARWQPEPAGPGWMHELDIWVAADDVDTMVPVAGRHRSLRNITWIEKPPADAGIVFRVLTTRLGARPAQVQYDDAVWLMGLPLINHPDGPQACLIAASSIALTDDHRAVIANARHAARSQSPETRDAQDSGDRIISVSLSSREPMSPILVDLSATAVPPLPRA